MCWQLHKVKNDTVATIQLSAVSLFVLIGDSAVKKMVRCHHRLLKCYRILMVSRCSGASCIFVPSHSIVSRWGQLEVLMESTRGCSGVLWVMGNVM